MLFGHSNGQLDGTAIWQTRHVYGDPVSVDHGVRCILVELQPQQPLPHVHTHPPVRLRHWRLVYDHDVYDRRHLRPRRIGNRRTPRGLVRSNLLVDGEVRPRLCGLAERLHFRGNWL